MYHVIVAEVFLCNRPYAHSTIGPCVDLHSLVLTIHHMTPKTTLCSNVYHVMISKQCPDHTPHVNYHVPMCMLSWFHNFAQTVTHKVTCINVYWTQRYPWCDHTIIRCKTQCCYALHVLIVEFALTMIPRYHATICFRVSPMINDKHHVQQCV